MRIGYIYVIINRINGKFYLGKTLDIKKRWNRHLCEARKHTNRKLYDSMNHYGYENFSIHIISHSISGDLKELEKILCRKERELILLTDSINIGYNMVDGGTGGYLGEEIHKKIGDKIKGRHLSEETRKKISDSNKGKDGFPPTDEIRKKISRTLIERGISPPPQYWGSEGYNEHPMKNKKHTRNARKKMSSFRSGKTYEEIYGREMALQYREAKRKKWMGNNNPQYKNIDIDKAIKDLKDGIEAKKLSIILGISYPTLLKKIKNSTGKTITQIRENGKKTSNN